MASGSRGIAALGASGQAVLTSEDGDPPAGETWRHRIPGCHKSRMLMLGSPRPGASRLTPGSSWSCSCPCKASSGRGEVGRGWTVRWLRGMQLAPGMHCAAILPLLPISTQQVTPTDCLLILISLEQGCPASQTALCPALHNSLINYHAHEHWGAAVNLEGQPVCCGSEVQGNTDPLTPWTGPLQAGCLKRHLLLCSYWGRRKVSPFLRERGRQTSKRTKGGGYL